MRWRLTILTLIVALCGMPAGARELCNNGHPAKRMSDVTYGGYRHGTYSDPCRPGELCCPPGTVRDHFEPLCLGGPDTAANVQCQPLEESYVKDADERASCEALCRGETTQGAEWKYFALKWRKR
jgi:hypothetical protein